jgi:hypothetical protein
VRALQEEVGDAALWHGRRVNLFDGSTLLLNATSELMEQYGSASNQHGRSHWPIMRIVAGFDLFSGAANEVAEGPYRTSEHTLAVTVLRALGPRMSTWETATLACITSSKSPRRSRVTWSCG